MTTRFASIFDATDQWAMAQCLSLAQSAQMKGEVPIAAAVLDAKRELVAKAHNRVISDNNPCGHAEVLALQAAAAHLGNYRLTDCTLYVTVEPCTMCFGALINARIKRLVYAVAEPRSGACGSLCSLHQLAGYTHQLEVNRGLCEEAAQKLLVNFFKQKRD